MQKKNSILAITIIVMFSFKLQAQYARNDTTFKKHFVGGSMFMLYNFDTKEKRPDYVQINFGYRLTGKDVVSLELKTWKYSWPLGIPFGKSFEAHELKFPGYIREFGVAFQYQRFWWKGLFAEINVMPALQLFTNEAGNKIDNGFQIFNTYRLGYHVKLFNDRFFVEPSIAITHRPYHTEMPESFKQLDDKYSRFFFGEPGLHFGVNF